ncbi:MAG: ATP-dependent helicase [Corynebacteriales bacterium]|nr:ATP-dependent helicase [Mycobacteriales bacterium]
MAAVSSATEPRYQLTRVQPRHTKFEPDDAQRIVTAHERGPLRVIGGPGTGKTSVLVEAVAQRIAAGADPSRMLILTFGRRAASQLRERIVTRMARTTVEPLARTFHSYAFGVLRRVAASNGWAAPRLLSGPEQDLMIRDLLAGDAAGIGVTWPERYLQVLGTRGFAAELRDLLLRCYERGIDPVQFEHWSIEHQRDDWRAAARFMQQYADVTELRDAARAASQGGGPAYDPAELIRAATAALRHDPELLAAERTRCEYVFVDEYQDIDPGQEELLRLLCQGGRFVVAFGDAQQSIFAFRGTDAGALHRFPDTFAQVTGEPAPTVELAASWRMHAGLLNPIAGVSDRIRGPVTPALRPLAEVSGSAEVHTLATEAQQAAYIAYRLRHAHLLENVPYRDMAVIVRAGARQLAALRRGLALAGVPAFVDGDEVPLLEQPAVRTLMLALRCALQPETLDPDAALALLMSPIGGADSLLLRRLRHELRDLAQRAEQPAPPDVLLAQALLDPAELAAVDKHWSEPAYRVANVLRAAREAAGGTAEQVLWALWQATGLAEQWQRAAAGGGATGSAADRDLDAVVALFEAAARFTDRMPAAGALLFLDHVRGHVLPGDSLAPTARKADAVELLTAHSAKGRQWDRVFIAGVNEGVWPDLRLRGSILGSEDIVDLAAQRPLEPSGRLTALLDEERRLFYVAASRARSALVVTAVESEDEEPSRFLDELLPLIDEDPRPLTKVPRSLTLSGLVAELRTAVIAGGDEADGAARQLASLARAGVFGADPQQWYGLPDVSDPRPLGVPGQRTRVSPSSVESFSQCGLKWFLRKAGGDGPPSGEQGVGLAVHEVAAEFGAPGPVNVAAMGQRLDSLLAQVQLGSGWVRARNTDRAHRMVGKLAEWLNSRAPAKVKVEEAFSAEVGEHALLSGRVDRLEVDEAGRVTIFDFKTGKSTPSKDKTQQHPQLGMYQLAVEAGAFIDAGTHSAGAGLVSLGGTEKAAASRDQPPLASADDPTWALHLADEAAVGMAAAEFLARDEAAVCRGCTLRPCCPLHSAQVTE